MDGLFDISLERESELEKRIDKRPYRRALRQQYETQPFVNYTTQLSIEQITTTMTRTFTIRQL